MKIKSIILTTATFIAFSNVLLAITPSDIFKLDTSAFICSSDSDSVKVDVNAPVISFDNRLYQLGNQIGTFDKKRAFKKGQATVNILVYNMAGKAVAEAVAAGINAPFVVTIYDGNQKLSLDLSFDHEGEELGLKLRQLGKL